MVESRPSRQRQEMAWELQASEIWRSLGEPEPPFDPYQLAPHFGLRIGLARQALPQLRDSWLFRARKVIYLNALASEAQRKFCVAHEVIHFLHPEITKERQVNFMAAALLLPAPRVREAFIEGWDLLDLRDKWCPTLSVEVVARRKLWFSDVAVSIWDEGGLRNVLRSPVFSFKQPHPLEEELAKGLFADRSASRTDLHERAYAVAVDTGPIRRVFTVMDKAWLAASR